MNKIVMIICLVLAVNGSALASENSVKLKYMPGLVAAGRFVDVSINPLGGDQTAAQVYAKLKAIEALGQMDYLVPDAPSITIEVTFEGKTLRSANSFDVPKPGNFAQYDRLWKEAYALAWQALEEDLKVK